MANPGEASASEASTIGSAALSALAELALALPHGWVAWIEAPNGQLGFGPDRDSRSYLRIVTSDGSRRSHRISYGYPRSRVRSAS